MTNWDLSAVDILKGTPDDDDDDDIDNESEANEGSESIISVADFTDFLCKAKCQASWQYITFGYNDGLRKRPFNLREGGGG